MQKCLINIHSIHILKTKGSCMVKCKEKNTWYFSFRIIFDLRSFHRILESWKDVEMFRGFYKINVKLWYFKYVLFFRYVMWVLLTGIIYLESVVPYIFSYHYHIYVELICSYTSSTVPSDEFNFEKHILFQII